MVKRIKKYFLCELGPFKWEKYGLLTCFLIIFIFCCYGDNASIIRFEIGLGRTLFEGKGLSNLYSEINQYADRYKIIQADTWGTSYATYDSPLQLLLGIWGIPLYFVCRWMGIDPMDSPWTILYGKSIYLIALFVTNWLLIQICKSLGASVKEAKWAPFLFTSSLFTLNSICVMGQCDIISIVIILAGLWAYIQDRIKLFLIFFAVALPFKLYGFFVFVPLLLLKEKRIYRLFLYLILVLIPKMLCNLPFNSDVVGMENREIFNAFMADFLTGQNIGLLGGAVPLFIILWGSICVYCYLRKPVLCGPIQIVSVFICYISMLMVFLSFDAYPYWYIHLSPYMVIILACYQCERKNLFLFETLGCLAITFREWFVYGACFSARITEKTFLPMLLGRCLQLKAPREIFGRLEQYIDLAAGFYVLCFLAIAYIGLRSDHIATDRSYKAGEVYSIRLFAIGRALVNILMASIPIILYLHCVM